jgi:hypothetical protein
MTVLGYQFDELRRRERFSGGGVYRYGYGWPEPLMTTGRGLADTVPNGEGNLTTTVQADGAAFDGGAGDGGGGSMGGDGGDGGGGGLGA